MTEQPEKKDEKKKEIVIPIGISMDKNCEIPENLKSWDTLDEQSPEYKDATNELDAVTTYIANLLNEGPEMKENMGKRVVTFKAVLQTLIKKVFVSNIERIGVLNQLIFSIQYEQEVRKMAMAYQAQLEAEKKKAAYYVQ